MIVVEPDAARADAARRNLAERDEYALQSDGSDLIVRREEPPTGAADWTHEAADAANRFASSDELVKWPLGVLWYSGEIDRFFTPEAHFQHERNPYPLVINGRMFVITHEKIHAVDIYTGRYFWQTKMPLTPYVAARYFDSRAYGRPTERNAVFALDRFYAVTGSEIHAYDTATGEPREVLDIPDSLRDSIRNESHEPRDYLAHGHRAVMQAVPEWTEVRLWQDLLLSFIGRNLSAVDRYTGELLWSRPSTREATTYAIGFGMVIGFEFDSDTISRERRRGQASDVEPSSDKKRHSRNGNLFALDPHNGSVIWEGKVDISPELDFEPISPRPWIEPLNPVVVINEKHELVVLAFNRNELRAFHAADGSSAWSIAPPALSRLSSQIAKFRLGLYSPVVTDDHVVNFSQSYLPNDWGHVFDVQTGRESSEHTPIPPPRTCGRAIGNNYLLVYRNASSRPVASWPRRCSLTDASATIRCSHRWRFTTCRRSKTCDRRPSRQVGSTTVGRQDEGANDAYRQANDTCGLVVRHVLP